MIYLTELNDDNYDNFINEKYSLIFIHAKWCQISNNIFPSIENISRDLHGFISVGTLDIDNRETVNNLSIRNTPTILIYENGNEVDRIVGNIEYEELFKIIKKNEYSKK